MSRREEGAQSEQAHQSEQREPDGRDAPARKDGNGRSDRGTRPTRRADLARVSVLALGFTLVGGASYAVAGALAAEPDEPLGLTVRSAAALLLVLPLVWVVCRTAGRTLVSVGLGTPARAWPPLVTAALSCGAMAALVVGAALLTGNATLGNGTPTAGSLASVAAIALLLTLLALTAQILPEELVFRGCIQHLLGYQLSQTATILLQAALFVGSVSLVLGSTEGLLDLALLGLFLGILRMTTGGIWAGVGVRLALTFVGIVLNSTGLVFTSGSAAWNLALGFGGALTAYLVIRVLLAARPDLTGIPAETEGLPRRRLPVRGILYDVGSSYVPGQHSREHWNPGAVREEMRVIDQDLHCTAVSLFGHDLDRMEQAARFALDRGLAVWLQPRSLDAGHAELVEHVERAADLAQRLREEFPEGPAEAGTEQSPAERTARVVLNVGCELTVINSGILPGRHMGHRGLALTVFALVPFYYNRRLNRVLRRLADGARKRFDGPLTYGSGTWETVDWAPFDIIGVDYYFDELTRSSYREGLRALGRLDGKPVVVTEFGCCAHRGAEAKGGSGGDALDWRDLDDRKVRGNLVRDEGVQATVIDQLIDVYETEDVQGAFLCMFIEGDCRYSPDPARDSDMASFGIVRPPALESGLSPDDGHWEPKEGFHTLARRYGADVPAGRG